MGSGAGIDICGSTGNGRGMRIRDARTAPNDASHWDRRSVTYGKHAGRAAADERHDVGEYDVRSLSARASSRGRACSTWAVAWAFSPCRLPTMGCHVVCADFSEGMLGRLRERAEAAGVLDRIEIRKLAWDDDWRGAGVGPDSVDVAIASRSLATYNLTDAW